MGQREAPGVHFFDPVPLDRHRTAALPRGPCEALGQKHVDLVGFIGAAEEAPQIVLRRRRFAGIGGTNAFEHRPLQALAIDAVEPHHRAGPDNIGRAQIGPQRRIDERAVIVSRIHVLHQRARRRVFAHRIQHGGAQGREFDRVQAVGRGKATGKRATQEDVAPARNHRSLAGFQSRAHERGGLAGERGSGKAALFCRQDTDLFGRPACGRRNVIARLEPEQIVELFRRHGLELGGRGDVGQIHARGIDPRRRRGHRLHHRSLGIGLRRFRRGCGCFRRRFLRRRQDAFRRALREDYCRGNDQRGTGQQQAAAHSAPSGRSTGCLIVRSGSSPPSTQAATRIPAIASRTTHTMFERLTAKFFVSLLKSVCLARALAHL